MAAGYDAGTDRLVFRLEDNGDGSFTFTLLDQLDHADESTDTGTMTLDLTGVFEAEDFDGDPVALADDSITVVVKNDVPTASITDGQGSVTIDESSGLQNDDTNATDVSDLFSSLTGVSSDMEQYAKSTFSLVDTSGSADGADEPLDKAVSSWSGYRR